MTQAKSISSRRKVTGCVLVFLAAGLVCALVWFVVAIAKEAPGVEEPVTVLETSVPVDRSQLPPDLSSRDWRDLSGRILRDNGWTGSLGLTSMSFHLRCTGDPQQPSVRSVSVIMMDGYLDAIVPSVRLGVVFYEPDKGTASVRIWYSRLSLPKTRVNLDRVEVGWREAFQAGQRLGGSEFYQAVGGECIISLRLHGDCWTIRYRDEREGQGHRWANWEVVVDAATGEAWRRGVP